ncbi:MAG: hypothetical protein GY795_32425 [Desulfobacterales bacterium]|nr:hypothetical protein [Desulfobacterales bacterium]
MHPIISNKYGANDAPFRKSIAAALLKIVFSIYLGIAVIVTSGQMIREYYDVKEAIVYELTVFEQVFAKSLGFALWNVDMPELESLVAGIIKFPDIVGIKVMDHKKNAILAGRGIVLNKEGEPLSMENGDILNTDPDNELFSKLFSHEFPVRYTHDLGSEHVGTTVIYSSSFAVFQKVKWGFLYILTSAIIKTVALWFIFLWVGRILLSRPLMALTSAAEQLQMDNLKNVRVDIRSSGENELKILAEVFNQMAAKLYYSRIELHKTNQHLEEAVKIRTAELVKSNIQLDRAREKAEAANRAKTEFLASMSHELRTPLNGIMGCAQILRRGRNLSTAQVDSLNVIYKSGHHLLTLINDVLDMAKIEAGKLELYPAPLILPDFLDGVAGIMRMAAHQKSIEFVFDVPEDMPVAVEADEKRLRQVLLNLLGNAVKFTDEGTVAFRVKIVEDCQFSTVNFQFSVQDTGVGMTPGQLTRIFEPFEQVGDEKKRSEGTGLGLAVTRRLVNLMGGVIQAESEPGRGSAFRFEIALPVLQDAIPGRQTVLIAHDPGTVLPGITQPSAVPGEEIIPPPLAELEALYKLAMFGDLERVQEKAGHLEDMDAKYAPFAHKLRGYAEEFEDEPILELLKRFMEPQQF